MNTRVYINRCRAYLKVLLVKKNRRGTSTRDLGVENGGVDSGFRRSHIPYKAYIPSE